MIKANGGGMPEEMSVEEIASKLGNMGDGETVEFANGATATRNGDEWEITVSGYAWSASDEFRNIMGRKHRHNGLP